MKLKINSDLSFLKIPTSVPASIKRTATTITKLAACPPALVPAKHTILTSVNQINWLSALMQTTQPTWLRYQLN
ncbi:MAG: hypothetical protein VSS75_034565 [Candidatus Parabeggiatoa sp.]|nr:hypothetical protein [Candidatus Parabeggiatoa sp.]